MTIIEIIQALREFPGDYQLCLSKFIACPNPNGGNGAYEMIFDLPIIGLAVNADDNEVRLVLHCDRETAESMGLRLKELL